MHPVRKHHRKKQATSVRALRGVLIALIYLLVITFVAYLLATFGWRWANDLLALNKQDITATITLDDDMFTEKETTDSEGNPKTVYQADMGQVSQELKDNGLIEYKWLFNLFATFTHKNTSMVPGTYELTTSMDYSALLRNMGARSSARTTVQIMVPEGYTCLLYTSAPNSRLPKSRLKASKATARAATGQRSFLARVRLRRIRDSTKKKIRPITMHISCL